MNLHPATLEVETQRTFDDCGLEPEGWRRFREFHAAHPHVYVLFDRFTREALAAGRVRVGAKEVWERMRWEAHVVARDGESTFALNNNLTAYYARHWMSRTGLAPFETRRQRDESPVSVCHGSARVP